MSFEEQIMSKDKYPSIFSRQMEAIVLIILESTCARIFLYLEQFSPQASLNSRESILYTALYCVVLSCVVLCCIVLYCTVWHKVRANLRVP